MDNTKIFAKYICYVCIFHYEELNDFENQARNCPYGGCHALNYPYHEVNKVSIV